MPPLAPSPRIRLPGSSDSLQVRRPSRWRYTAGDGVSKIPPMLLASRRAFASALLNSFRSPPFFEPVLLSGSPRAVSVLGNNILDASVRAVYSRWMRERVIARVRIVLSDMRERYQQVRSWLLSPPQSEGKLLDSVLGFFEGNLVASVMGVAGGLLAPLYPKMLFLCGAVLILAVHRHGIVRGRSRVLQTIVYVVASFLTVLQFSGVIE